MDFYGNGGRLHTNLEAAVGDGQRHGRDVPLLALDPSDQGMEAQIRSYFTELDVPKSTMC